MTWIADGHRDWHTVNGWSGVICPLDCAAGEINDDYYIPEDAPRIRCAHCRGTHVSVLDVRLCAGVL